jgi:hypothetical protein
LLLIDVFLKINKASIVTFSQRLRLIAMKGSVKVSVPHNRIFFGWSSKDR